MLFGQFLSSLIPTSISNILGGLTLTCIGIWFLIQYINDRKKTSINFLNNNTSITNKYSSNNITIKETIPLSFALTINNLGAGIAASISGVSIFYSTIITFLVTIISIFLGCFLGRSIIGNLFGKYAPLVSSLILIILGIYESIL